MYLKGRIHTHKHTPAYTQFKDMFNFFTKKHQSKPTTSPENEASKKAELAKFKEKLEWERRMSGRRAMLGRYNYM